MTDTDIAAELQRAEPAIACAVHRMLRLPRQDREDAAQTARLVLLAALRKGAVFQTRGGYAVAAKFAIINDFYRRRGQKMRFDSYEHDKALSEIPAREQDVVQVLASEETVCMVLARLRKRFSPLRCDMFECYLRGDKQRDLCVRFKKLKPRVSRVINTMLEAAAGILGVKGY